MTAPSILLIPGSFSPPNYYAPIVSSVAALNFSIHAVQLLSTGLGPDKPGAGSPPPTMYDDAAVIAAQIEQLADQGKDVLLVAHSYGGVPTSQCTRGLWREERRRAGKEGGIVRIAYMSAVVPARGEAAVDVLKDVPEDNQYERGDEGWMYFPPSALPLAARFVFSDLEPGVGEAEVRKFTRHSAGSFMGELTHAGYADIPVSYLLCDEDLTIPAGVQRRGIEVIEKASGRKVDVTSIGAGHCPNVSMPQVVVDWIVGVAGKV